MPPNMHSAALAKIPDDKYKYTQNTIKSHLQISRTGGQITTPPARCGDLQHCSLWRLIPLVSTDRQVPCTQCPARNPLAHPPTRRSSTVRLGHQLLLVPGPPVNLRRPAPVRHASLSTQAKSAAPSHAIDHHGREHYSTALTMCSTMERRRVGGNKGF